MNPIRTPFPRRLFRLLLSVCFAAGAVSPAAAGNADFQLTVARSNQLIECRKVRLDPGSIRCRRGDITYRYRIDAIERVQLNGETIYPYPIAARPTLEDLRRRDCDYLKAAIRGPLILENDPELFVLVGTMYEHGICTRKNVQKACGYYRRAGELGEKRYGDLRKRMN